VRSDLFQFRRSQLYTRARQSASIAGSVVKTWRGGDPRDPSQIQLVGSAAFIQGKVPDGLSPVAQRPQGRARASGRTSFSLLVLSAFVRDPNAEGWIRAVAPGRPLHHRSSFLYRKFCRTSSGGLALAARTREQVER